ncbi:MAG: Asp-tRNA(Asn)/Glu-tRNA(Gln) amidotransferase subunit GatA [Planctomycetota bacterium]|nr:MAG: Asp-tRNA(Asn)/Glu-tRNA(Gln) amidotransferase subunit GatA [Planctomycetota bacterium]
MSLLQKSAVELVSLLRDGELTSADLTRAYLNQIEEHEGTIQAFLHVDREAALQQAEDLDRRRAAGENMGPLGGLPVAVKDLLCTRGVTTTCASRMLENFRPPYDATVIARLKAAGAVLIGRTNLDEFAMGGSCENSAFQTTRNPWDPERIPGGSSGGAAACVAAAMAPLSVGSDTGGSIRQPAALCGVTGLKPTYGRVSRYGLVAFASSLDQIGPLAATAEDVALLLEVLAGHDPLDSTSIDAPVPRYIETVRQPLEGLRVGLVTDHLAEQLDPDVEAAVREAVRVYESLGANVEEVSLPHSRYGIATYYVIAPSEASSNLARYDGAHYGYRTDESALQAELAAERAAAQSEQEEARLDTPLVRMYRKTRSEGFGAEVKRRIMLGTYALSSGYYDAYYLKALKVRRLIVEDYRAAFQKADVLLGPVTPSPAMPLGHFKDDPLGMYLTDLFTVGANLAGIAGISLPCGQSREGLPIGLHLQAPPLEEERLLRAAHMFQTATDWHRRRPDFVASED